MEFGGYRTCHRNSCHRNSSVTRAAANADRHRDRPGEGDGAGYRGDALSGRLIARRGQWLAVSDGGVNLVHCHRNSCYRNLVTVI